MQNSIDEIEFLKFLKYNNNNIDITTDDSWWYLYINTLDK